MINNLKYWSLAHIDREILHKKLLYSGASFNSDVGWLKYFVSETPNGAVFRNNVLYDIYKKNKIYLAHITLSLAKITEEKKLFSSSGCLVGAIYCVPVIQEGKKLRLHNLGEYILAKEAPAFGGNRAPDVLLIELESLSPKKHSHVGIDYLKLGQIHFQIFSELSYLLSHSEIKTLKREATDSVCKISDMLKIVERDSSKSVIKNFKKFYELYRQSIIYSPILGYILFETLCEYVALFQKGKMVEHYASKGELYCPNFKKMLFDFCPDATNSFNLGLFRPKLNELSFFLNSVGIPTNSNSSLEEFLVRRLCYLVSTRLYDKDSDKISRKLFWQNIKWDFSYLQQQLTPLLGHTIHRFLRNMKRYPDFYFYFDQYKALHVWNYWNSALVMLPHNAILPKGEIGINPAYPYMKYSIFTVNPYQEHGCTYLSKKERVPFKIEPRLVELNNLLMRKRYDE